MNSEFELGLKDEDRIPLHPHELWDSNHVALRKRAHDFVLEVPKPVADLSTSSSRTSTEDHLNLHETIELSRNFKGQPIKGRRRGRTLRSENLERFLLAKVSDFHEEVIEFTRCKNPMRSYLRHQAKTYMRDHPDEAGRLNLSKGWLDKFIKRNLKANQALLMVKQED